MILCIFILSRLNFCLNRHVVTQQPKPRRSRCILSKWPSKRSGLSSLLLPLIQTALKLRNFVWLSCHSKRLPKNKTKNPISGDFLNGIVIIKPCKTKFGDSDLHRHQKHKNVCVKSRILISAVVRFFKFLLLAQQPPLPPPPLPPPPLFFFFFFFLSVFLRQVHVNANETHA